MQTDISPNMEDYLEQIYMALLDKGEARVKDISDSMNVRMPSVNNAITMLKKHDLVIQEPYGAIELTKKGRSLAERILNRHQVLTKFLLSLGVSVEVAEKDACEIEHIITEETFAKIKEYYNAKLR